MSLDIDYDYEFIRAKFVRELRQRVEHYPNCDGLSAALFHWGNAMEAEAFLESQSSSPATPKFWATDEIHARVTDAVNVLYMFRFIDREVNKRMLRDIEAWRADVAEFHNNRVKPAPGE